MAVIASLLTGAAVKLIVKITEKFCSLSCTWFKGQTNTVNNKKEKDFFYCF